MLKSLVKSGNKYLTSMLQHKLTIIVSYIVSNELNKNRFCGGFNAFLSEGKPMLKVWLNQEITINYLPSILQRKLTIVALYKVST